MEQGEDVLVAGCREVLKEIAVGVRLTKYQFSSSLSAESINGFFLPKFLKIQSLLFNTSYEL
jgi:hypothetical protein